MKINTTCVIVLLIAAITLGLLGDISIFSNKEVAAFAIGMLVSLMAIVFTSKSEEQEESGWLDRRHHPLPDKKCRLMIMVLNNAASGMKPGKRIVFWNPEPKGADYIKHRYLGYIGEDVPENQRISLHVFESPIQVFTHYKIIEE